MWLRPAVCRLLAALPHLPRRFRGGAPFEVPNGCWRFVRKGREWGLRRFAAYPYFGGRPWRPLDHSGWRSAAKISAMHKAYVWPWPCHVCVRDRCRRQRCVGSRQGRCRGRGRGRPLQLICRPSTALLLELCPPVASGLVPAAVAWKQQRHLPLMRPWRSPLSQTGAVVVETRVEVLAEAPAKVAA